MMELSSEFASLPALKAYEAINADHQTCETVLQRVEALLRGIHAEYREVEQDYGSALFELACDEPWIAEDVEIPGRMLRAIAVNAAYCLGYMVGQQEMARQQREKQRQRFNETRLLQHYFAWTHAPQLVKQHEVEFFAYLEELEPVLMKACGMLLAGYTLSDTAKQLGFKDMRTLKSRLRKAFGKFLDDKEDKQ